MTLMALFFVVAGDPAPSINEAHYLVKAKNFWDPSWCQNDLFAASGKAHTTFYWLLGWPTRWVSLDATAWIGRMVGWGIIAAGLIAFCGAAGIRGAVVLVVATVWVTGVFYCNLAGEWVIGGIEAKVPAYGLVLFGWAAVLRGRWGVGWVWLGGAAAWHVLTGGWAMVATAVAWLILPAEGRQPPRSPGCMMPTARGTPGADAPRLGLFGLIVGGLLSLFGIVPAAQLSRGVDPAAAAHAARIYVEYRIPHHLLPTSFPVQWYVRFAGLTLAAAVAWRLVRRNGARRRIDTIAALVIGSLAITATGLAIGWGVGPQSDRGASLLRLYWFRLADAVVPLGLAMMVGFALTQKSKPVRRAGGVLASVAAIGLAAVAWRSASDGVPDSLSNRYFAMNPDASAAHQRRAMTDWIAVCQFIAAATPRDEVFLTPRRQQTFKWYAGRAEVVNWKDVPQDAASLRRWAARMKDVFPPRLNSMRTTVRYSDLRRMRRRYGVRWMVVDRRVTGATLPLEQVYPSEPGQNRTFAVYEPSFPRSGVRPGRRVEV